MIWAIIGIIVFVIIYEFLGSAINAVGSTLDASKERDLANRRMIYTKIQEDQIYELRSPLDEIDTLVRLIGHQSEHSFFLPLNDPANNAYIIWACIYTGHWMKIVSAIEKWNQAQKQIDEIEKKIHNRDLLKPFHERTNEYIKEHSSFQREIPPLIARVKPLLQRHKSVTDIGSVGPYFDPTRALATPHAIAYFILTQEQEWLTTIANWRKQCDAIASKILSIVTSEGIDVRVEYKFMYFTAHYSNRRHLEDSTRLTGTLFYIAPTNDREDSTILIARHDAKPGQAKFFDPKFTKTGEYAFNRAPLDDESAAIQRATQMLKEALDTKRTPF